jgi:L-ascorbate metabolism protein UlaG (beta-lactamase superfamily)
MNPPCDLFTGRIVYIVHNCFVLKVDTRTFLFDCPSDEHLSLEQARMITSYIKGADLTVFCSHSHDDHFNHNLSSLTEKAARAAYVLSDDIADLYPDALPAESLIVEPDETYKLNGMTIQTLMSNDLGVAFLISVNGLKIYFAGDLANWIWPGMPEKAKSMAQAFFEHSLEVVGRKHVHIAFSDLDTRLENLTGGPEVMQTLQPDIFVPMHSFGDPNWASRIASSISRPPGQVFAYAKPGDSLSFQLCLG